MSGDKTERAGGEANGDVAIAVLVVEDGAVELERGIGAEREVGAVRHHEARGALSAGLHRLIAQDAVADIDLAGRHCVEDFVFDKDRFADARLCMGARCRNEGGSKKQKRKEHAPTQIHFIDRSTVRHRTGSRVRDVVYLSLAWP
jgi:hypothetical protein